MHLLLKKVTWTKIKNIKNVTRSSLPCFYAFCWSAIPTSCYIFNVFYSCIYIGRYNTVPQSSYVNSFEKCMCSCQWYIVWEWASLDWCHGPEVLDSFDMNVMYPWVNTLVWNRPANWGELEQTPHMMNNTPTGAKNIAPTQKVTRQPLSSSSPSSSDGLVQSMHDFHDGFHTNSSI